MHVQSLFCEYCRFTKNLSADKINLSTFKGEGELTNLELDEAVLTDLLELPSWLRLTSAWCNKVSFRIQWTKLKSVPIFLVNKTQDTQRCTFICIFLPHSSLTEIEIIQCKYCIYRVWMKFT